MVAISKRNNIGVAAAPAFLSPAQERLWFLDQIDPGNASLNIARAVTISGALDRDLLQRSLNQVVARHESLRTTFATTQLYAGVDSRPVQIVADSRNVCIELVDLTISVEQARHSFDLSLGPLIRATLMKTSDQSHTLLIVAHRIIADEESLNILFRELFQIYATGTLPSLTLQYSKYAARQLNVLESDAARAAINYWRETLESAPAAIELPTYRLRPHLRTSAGATVSTRLSEKLVSSLRAMTDRQGVPLSTTLLAAFAVLLARYSRQTDLVVGLAVSNRQDEDVRNLIGAVSNLLPLRIDLSPQEPFSEFLARLRTKELDASERGFIPFEKLLEELNVERSLSRPPLVQVTFNLRSEHETVHAGPLTIQTFDFDPGVNNFELTLDIVESADALECRFGYNSDIYDATTIESMSSHFKVLLGAIASEPDRQISMLPLLSVEEQHRLCVEWNDTKTDFRSELLTPSMFELQVAKTPHYTAVVFGDQRIDYSQLNRRANQLAHHLRSLGVGLDSRVGICIERGIGMAVAVLAVLKAGGAYVPLDPAYPAERLRFMLDDADIRVLLTDEQSARMLPANNRVLRINVDAHSFADQRDDNLQVRIHDDNLGYVIYTSGSTGQPKGVAMTHRALRNVLSWQTQQNGGPYRTLQFASLSFDVSFQEMLSTWCSGGTLILITEETRKDTRALLHVIDREQIQQLFLPFVFLQHLAEVIDDGEQLPVHLRSIITAGEQLEITPQIGWLFSQHKNLSLHNHYGPSETHVVTAYQLEDAVDKWSKLPPIGRPIANTRIYILDEVGQMAPVGVAGELWIGGENLSRGYLNRPELTAEKYAPNRFTSEPGARVYRTGDLARYLPNGNIEFLGRADNQVKIRGYRIEPGEVEAALREHPLVREVAVIANQGKLVAYVVRLPQVNGDGVKPANVLREFLGSKLPAYMVPAFFIELDNLPLTPSGKINRRALPAPEESRAQKDLIAPRDTVEEQLVKLWTNILQVKPISVTDNFFELGGDSLLAARLFAQIHNRFGKNLPLSTLFVSPTIEQLANVLRESDTEAAWSSLVPIQPRGSKPPLFCVHAAGANVLIYRPMSRHLGDDQPVYALQAQGLDGRQEPLRRVEDMARRYVKEIRTLQPDGPYYLLGASFGGLVAYEMAQQLLSQRQEVAFLGLLNTNCPVYSLGKKAICHLGHLRQRGLLNYSRAVAGSVRRRLNLVSSDQQTSNADVRGLVPEQADDALVQTVAAIFEAEQKYVPANNRYPGKVTLFWANDAPRDFEDNRLAWRKVAAGGLEIHVVPGSHTKMREEPHVQTLVEKLRPSLEKAQALVV
ncbi:MAG TPA: amino acid adenylation domain-containing protein [Pyrinomonadaceae bacterium]|nr:amino acid adenylation domain-containing protein [Pyrinomonadaceae bacterium]